MKLILFTLFLVSGFLYTHAQENYDASLIPKELLQHASSVIRDQQMSVRVESLDNTIVQVKSAITVLNKNGDEDAEIVLEYDKSRVIKSVKGIILNEFGKPVTKFSEGDFENQSAWDGFSLFLDDKIKYYRPAFSQYPYTVVYEYEMKLKQSLDFPQWEPVPGYGVAVQKSSFTFTCAKDFNIRYKENNFHDNLVRSKNSALLNTYTWSVSNIKAAKIEPYRPYYKNVTPYVQVAPEKFRYFGLDGSFTDWKTLGKWEYDKLLASRTELSPETIEHMRDLTKDISDPKLKAKKIYEYMQGKTHYISVQVGIGGNQPFLASDVDKQNYGDCKALVNYTRALLKAVNIDSWYCVVESGSRYKVNLLSDFASMDQGNHIILCIPFKNDTTWADCTSQTIPFGYLGDFTDDRDVLACTPEGGKLIHTPKYTVEDDLEKRSAEFVIDANGGLSGNMKTIFFGTNFDSRDEIVNEPVKEQYKMIQKIYPINNMDIVGLDFKQDKSFKPFTTENIKLNARDYASLSDGKCFFMINSVNRIESPPNQVTNRQNDVYISRGFTDIDEITYTIPAGYRLEKVPLNITMDKPFGKFIATMELKGNLLTYKRKFQLIDGTYGKDTYQDLVDFFQDVVDADEYTVSLVKS
ncbi:DUF3857 domain-containing protein [Mucilaginibacter sp.]|uniref:DUF3857 domain-containing protein n=1 Tax=Mucilaginibacter sp. TaxID=1882438 RepID=UPI00284BE6ED|nr:DUF3857 domain-containing protein [Mucilaginibacter sp.]MDR3696072.1 DUF3857 domain-containing protein [Mucilaginibacter sp.]